MFDEIRRNPPDDELSSNDDLPVWIHYIYIVDPETRMFYVLESSCATDSYEDNTAVYQVTFSCGLDEPDPEFGDHEVKAKETTKSVVECTCSMFTIMSKGCPRVKGGVCE